MWNVYLYTHHELFPQNIFYTKYRKQISCEFQMNCNIPTCRKTQLHVRFWESAPDIFTNQFVTTRYTVEVESGWTGIFHLTNNIYCKAFNFTLFLGLPSYTATWDNESWSTDESAHYYIGHIRGFHAWLNFSPGRVIHAVIWFSIFDDWTTPFAHTSLTKSFCLYLMPV